MRFSNRTDAGQKLARKVAEANNIPNAIVLALPRGGIPVGLEIAHELQVPFDIFLVRKLGVPGHEELAMGALAYGNVLILNDNVIRSLDVPQALIEEEIRHEQQELERRNRLYREGREAPDVKDRSIVLVDDGIATGATMRAGIAALRKQDPQQIVVAVPVAPKEVHETLADADRIICLDIPEPFYGVGMHYNDFSQLRDEEVKAMLAREPHFS
jgi:putative phosphoribosyl transferase